MAKDKKNPNKPGMLSGIKSELKRVSYPTFKQVCKNTGVVLIVVLILGIFIFALDSVFGFLTKKMLTMPSWNNPTEQTTEQSGSHYHYIDVNGVEYEDMGDGTFAPITAEGLGEPISGDLIEFVSKEEISNNAETVPQTDETDNNEDETQNNEEE